MRNAEHIHPRWIFIWLVLVKRRLSLLDVWFFFLYDSTSNYVALVLMDPTMCFELTRACSHLVSRVSAWQHRCKVAFYLTWTYPDWPSRFFADRHVTFTDILDLCRDFIILVGFCIPTNHRWCMVLSKSSCCNFETNGEPLGYSYRNS
jgi:hypothetical protein